MRFVILYSEIYGRIIYFYVNICNKMFKKSKVFRKNADKYLVGYVICQRYKYEKHRKENGIRRKYKKGF